MTSLFFYLWVRVMVFNTTFNNILVISCGGNRSSQRKPLTCHKSLTITSTPHLSGIRTHNVSGDRH